MKKIVITGGAGYIGSVLTGLLLQHGYSVVVIDSLLFGGEAVLPYLSHPQFRFLHTDIADITAISPELDDVSAVVHLAAIVGDPACAKFPDEAERVNSVAARKFCRLVIDKNIPRFVFASTCSNYGKMPDHDGYVDESTELQPVSLYAEQKVAFEQFLLTMEHERFEPVCLRFATAFGLSPRPRFDLTVNEFTKELTLQRNLEIYGQQFWRPYCHTTDLAEACRLAIEAPAEVAAYQAFNVGSTKENYQKQQLVDLITARVPETEDLVDYIEKDEDPRDYRVSFSKIEQALQFQTKKTVADGIDEISMAITTKLIQNPDDQRYRNV